MTEGLAPLPEAHWRAVWREQAARGARARHDAVQREDGDRCRGCGRLASGLYPIVGLSPAKEGYLCGGCWARTYGGAA